MPDRDLLPEAKRRMEEYALAKSTIKDGDAWFTKHWPKLGNIEHAGMWMGGRQKFTEVLKPTIFIEAMYLTLQEDEMPADVLVEILTPAQMKGLSKHPDWGQRIMARVENLDKQDKGYKRDWGKLNVSPVKDQPSLNNYAILEPGDELFVTEPDVVPQAEEAEPDEC